MLPERSSEMPKERPPEWWHEAIRKNIQGNLINKDTFISTEELFDDFTSTIVSLTAQDPTSKLPEGIYIVTNIPSERVSEFNTISSPAFSKFCASLNTEYKSRKQANLPTPGANENDIPVDALTFFPNGKIYAYLVPETKKQPKTGTIAAQDLAKVIDNLNHIYFGGLEDASRIKLLFDRKFPEILKKAYLKKELASNNMVLEFYYGKKTISRKELKSMASKKKLQNEYLNLLKRISRSKTGAEGEKLIDILAAMEGPKYAGWLDFYRRYWERKFGPLI